MFVYTESNDLRFMRLVHNFIITMKCLSPIMSICVENSNLLLIFFILFMNITGCVIETSLTLDVVYIAQKCKLD